MRFQDLELFVAVAEEGSFSAAARRLELSQPGVRGRVAVMEQEMDTLLLNRDARRVTPTASGKLLYEEGLKLLAGLDGIKQRIQEESAQPVGPLALSAGEASGVYLAPLLLGWFNRAHPRVEPKLYIHLIAKTMADILEQRFGLGIVPFQPEDPRLEAAPLCDDELTLVVPVGHPLAGTRDIEAKELLRHPMVVREREARVNSTLGRSLEPLGVKLSELNMTMELSSNEALKTAVASGFGIAFISRMALRGDSASYCPVRVAGLDTRRTFYLIRRVSESHSFAERAFWAYCQQESVRREVERVFGR